MKKSTKVYKIIMILAGILGIGMLSSFVLKSQDSRYMLISQTHHKTEQMLKTVMLQTVPASQKQTTKKQLPFKIRTKKILKHMLYQVFAVAEYESMYAQKQNLDDVVWQEVPISYLEDGGEAEETECVEETEQVEVKTEQKEKKKKNGYTYSSRYSDEQLTKASFLKSHFYAIDEMTPVYAKDFEKGALLSRDLSINKDTKAPSILIYHTHASEAFKDSRKGKTEDTVVGVGDVLAEELEQKYGFKVLHDRNTYDMINGKLDRSLAYNVAGRAVEEHLARYPSISVIIDLHRDGVAEQTHLLTQIDGRDTATIMFFNGMSRSKARGEITYLKNENRSDNLAFSLQMQLASKEISDDFTRKIFVRSYRYNLHYRGRSTLIEAGAQTNTVQEVKNAMYPLARILNEVLSK